jgi:hypothetical protein
LSALDAVIDDSDGLIDVIIDVNNVVDVINVVVVVDNDMNEVVVDDKVVFVVVIEVILIRTALFCRLLYELLSTTVLQVFMRTKIRNTAYNGASTVQQRVRVPRIKFRFL